MNRTKLTLREYLQSLHPRVITWLDHMVYVITWYTSRGTWERPNEVQLLVKLIWGINLFVITVWIVINLFLECFIIDWVENDHHVMILKYLKMIFIYLKIFHSSKCSKISSKMESEIYHVRNTWSLKIFGHSNYVIIYVLRFGYIFRYMYKYL